MPGSSRRATGAENATLHKEWRAVAAGRNVAPVDTDYATSEGAHIDPDGNLIRHGSRT